MTGVRTMMLNATAAIRTGWEAIVGAPPPKKGDRLPQHVRESFDRVQSKISLLHTLTDRMQHPRPAHDRPVDFP